MSNQIIVEPAPAGTSYDQFKVYRSTTATGTYTLVITQALTDLTYVDTVGVSTSWYKISYYDSSAGKESDISEPIQVLNLTYTTVRKVQDILCPNLTITDSTTPNVQQVADAIIQAEDEIDRKTGRAWRQRFSNTASGKDTQANYEFYTIKLHYEHRTGRPVYLNHSKIRTFSATSGDAIGFWNGSSYEDYLAKTEGRGNEYWVDYEEGTIYYKDWLISDADVQVRVKYRYGETSVSGEVERIATLLAAKYLLAMDATVGFRGEGGIKPEILMDRWEREASQKLSELHEAKLVTD